MENLNKSSKTNFFLFILAFYNLIQITLEVIYLTIFYFLF